MDGLPACYSTDNASNVLPVYLMDYLRELGFKGVTPQTIDGCLSCIADQNRYNPIETYLTGGTWDGEDRFPEIYRILGVSDIRHQMYITKWFCQCVALGLNREDKPIGADGVLVLQGPRGWPRPRSSVSWRHSPAGLWRVLWWTWATRTV